MPARSLPGILAFSLSRPLPLLALRLGVGLTEMLGVVGAVTAGIDTMASALARLIRRGDLEPVSRTGQGKELSGFLARGRIPLLHGVASMLADRLAAALVQLSADITDGEALRDAIDRIRVGAITDSSAPCTEETRDAHPTQPARAVEQLGLRRHPETGQPYERPDDQAHIQSSHFGKADG